MYTVNAYGEYRENNGYSIYNDSLTAAFIARADGEITASVGCKFI